MGSHSTPTNLLSSTNYFLPDPAPGISFLPSTFPAAPKMQRRSTCLAVSPPPEAIGPHPTSLPAHPVPTPHPKEAIQQLSTSWMTPHPWTFLENARPFPFHSKCKFSVPRCTPDRIVAIDLLVISTPGHPTHSHCKAPQDFLSQNAASGINSTHIVIFINTHLLLQQLCPCPLNYNIVVFLNSGQPEWTSNNDPMNICHGWTSMGWEQKRGGRRRHDKNMTPTPVSQPPYIFCCLVS